MTDCDMNTLFCQVASIRIFLYRPISSSGKSAKRLRFEKEEQRRDRTPTRPSVIIESQKIQIYRRFTGNKQKILSVARIKYKFHNFRYSPADSFRLCVA